MLRRKVDPDQWFEAIEGFATDTPTRGTVVARGKKLPGSDPIVKAHRELFVPVGDPVPSIDSRVAARVAAREVHEATQGARTFDPTRDRHFVAVKSWRGNVVDARGIPYYRFLGRGEVVRPGDPLVRNRPELFEEVKPKT